MHIKEGLMLREIAGEHLVIKTSEENSSTASVYSMNETAAFLWQEMSSKGSFGIEDLISSIVKEYEIDAETAETDSRELLSNWLKLDLIEK